MTDELKPVVPVPPDVLSKIADTVVVELTGRQCRVINWIFTDILEAAKQLPEMPATAAIIARAVGLDGAICPAGPIAENIRPEDFTVFAGMLPEDKYLRLHHRMPS